MNPARFMLQTPSSCSSDSRDFEQSTPHPLDGRGSQSSDQSFSSDSSTYDIGVRRPPHKPTSTSKQTTSPLPECTGKCPLHCPACPPQSSGCPPSSLASAQGGAAPNVPSVSAPSPLPTHPSFTAAASTPFTGHVSRRGVRVGRNPTAPCAEPESELTLGLRHNRRSEMDEVGEGTYDNVVKSIESVQRLTAILDEVQVTLASEYIPEDPDRPDHGPNSPVFDEVRDLLNNMQNANDTIFTECVWDESPPAPVTEIVANPPYTTWSAYERNLLQEDNELQRQVRELLPLPARAETLPDSDGETPQNPNTSRDRSMPVLEQELAKCWQSMNSPTASEYQTYFRLGYLPPHINKSWLEEASSKYQSVLAETPLPPPPISPTNACEDPPFPPEEEGRSEKDCRALFAPGIDIHKLIGFMQTGLPIYFVPFIDILTFRAWNHESMLAIVNREAAHGVALGGPAPSFGTEKKANSLGYDAESVDPCWLVLRLPARYGNTYLMVYLGSGRARYEVMVELLLQSETGLDQKIIVVNERGTSFDITGYRPSI